MDIKTDMNLYIWCHQCKTKYSNEYKICSKSTCKKKYCNKCIKRHYKDDNSNECYFCRNICVCAQCKRIRDPNMVDIQPLKKRKKNKLHQNKEYMLEVIAINTLAKLKYKYIYTNS